MKRCHRGATTQVIFFAAQVSPLKDAEACSSGESWPWNKELMVVVAIV